MEQTAQRTHTERAAAEYGRVERRAISSETEIREYLRSSTPVIIEGALHACPAFARWSSPAALGERVGDIVVPLTRLPTGPIRYYRDLPHEPTAFSRCVELIFGDDERSYYVHQADLIEQSPQLKEDLVFPYPGLGLSFQQALFWIGSGDTVSRLHCDFPHNFIGQFKGRKRFRIFPHAQASNFYPPPPYAPDPYHTPVSTMGDTSLSEYPRFANARGLEAVIGEGDMLVLPSLWWHQVIAEQASVMVNWFGLTPAMERDWPRLSDWAWSLYTEQWELGISLARRFEDANNRDAGLAATARLLIEKDRPDLARRALHEVANPRYAEEMACMFERT